MNKTDTPISEVDTVLELVPFYARDMLEYREAQLAALDKFARRLERNREDLIEVLKRVQQLDYFQEHNGLANMVRSVLESMKP